MKKLYIISIAFFGLLFTSCDSYLDINKDQSSPSEENMTADIMMPAAEINLATSYGDYLRITSGYFAQYYGQLFGTSNYTDYSQFTMSATRSSGTYTQLNVRVLNTLNTVANKAKASGNTATFLAAKTLKAFTFQTLVDCYGEVPYSEAFDVANTSPKYDEGVDIYAGILAELDEALAAVKSSDQVCRNFLFGKGETTTVDNWVKFANAVKLRILTRESGVVDVKAKIAALIEENNFPTSDVQYAGIWKNEQNAASPFYSEEFSAWKSQENVTGNIAIMNTLIQKDADGGVTYSDPRMASFFKKNGSGEYTGSVGGTNFSTSKKYQASFWCRPVATYDMPVILIPLCEVNFMISEYYATTGANVTKATEYYNKAIEASFASSGVTGAADYISKFPFDAANYKKSIGVAKWTALCGLDPFEGYCELRRLGYPTFSSVSGTDLYDESTDTYSPNKLPAGTLYTPLHVFNEVGSKNLLQRWPYAESSATRNGNTPAFKGYKEPIFWGKK